MEPRLTYGDAIIWRRPLRDGSVVLVRGEFWYRTTDKITIRIRRPTPEGLEELCGETQTIVKHVDPDQIRPAQMKETVSCIT